MNENFLLSREKVISKVKRGMIPLAKRTLVGPNALQFLCTYSATHRACDFSPINLFL